MTLQKIAKKAGVSVSTVSKALANSKEISPETSERVREIAAEIGYFQKFKKFNTTYNTPVIALICPEVRYSSMIDGLSDLISQSGGIMNLSVSDFDVEQEKKLLDYYCNHVAVDGIILMGVNYVYKNNEYKINKPVVVLNDFDICDFDSVRISVEDAIEDAITYLVDLGHGNIGFIGEKKYGRNLQLFERVMKKMKLKINPDFIAMSDKRFKEAGYDAMDTLFKKNALPPSGIIASNDTIGFGALYCIEDYGKKVPDDFSVIGAGDIEVSRFVNSNLTSVKLHTDECCNIAMELLLKKMNNNGYKTVQHIILKPKLVIGDSTAKKKRDEILSEKD